MSARGLLAPVFFPGVLSVTDSAHELLARRGTSAEELLDRFVRLDWPDVADAGAELRALREEREVLVLYRLGEDVRGDSARKVMVSLTPGLGTRIETEAEYVERIEREELAPVLRFNRGDESRSRI